MIFLSLFLLSCISCLSLLMFCDCYHEYVLRASRNIAVRDAIMINRDFSSRKLMASRVKP